MGELKVIKVWATLDYNREFPYVDVYNNKEEAERDIGETIDGLLIDGVVQGWCVVGDTEANLKDFHFTYDEAVDEKNAVLFG